MRLFATESAMGERRIMYITSPPKRSFGIIDVLVLFFIFSLLYLVLNLAGGMKVPFSPGQVVVISLDPRNLPYYAGRSLLRMFIAYGASLLFTFIYGYLAAKNRAAEKVLIPLLDILQSVPVLGFLSITIVGFMALFPGSLLGVELASIFAIFTAQAWNMTFSFYHSLVTIPQDLKEAADVLRLNPWQRFVRLEVPFSMIGLVWNSMMSFGGAWFFLAASEAISVLGKNIVLPGVGSYLATAIAAGDIRAVLYSMATMIIMIILVDQLFWRPLVVWSQIFKMEQTGATIAPTSFVHDILHHSTIIKYLRTYILSPPGKLFGQAMDALAVNAGKASRTVCRAGYDKIISIVVKSLIALGFVILVAGPIRQGYSLVSQYSWEQLLQIAELGFFTLCRVLAAICIGALWTVPVGVWIGLNPRISKIMQPLIQIAASFPANMLFPFVTVLFLEVHFNFEYGSILLMLLGTQWYILFNVIAGAMAIPNDLREAGQIYKLKGWHKWKMLILPGIFAYLVTGCLTAAGGAWNASIVAELVVWKGTTLQATGLGAFIDKATAQGNWAGIIWGITVMSLIVVTVNRLLWRRLYRLAEIKYHLD
jgi:NitT/TauT family transport system permease protein